VDHEQIEEQLAGRKGKPQRARIQTNIEDPQEQTPEESLSEDSDDAAETDSEDEFSMEEDDSSESEDEFHEQAPLSHDHVEYVHSHNLQNTPGHRHSIESHDSRLEPGNEQYEQDDFVVDDDESIVMEDSEDSETSADDSDDAFDLTINMDRDPVRVGYQAIGRAHRASSIFSDADRRRRSSTAISSKKPASRQLSQASYSRRRSSSLFVSDPNGDPSITQQLMPWLQAAEDEVELEAPLIAQASAEVVEEIIDALALFSRRVNRDRPHVRLRLAAAVLEDEEIRDALEDAIRTGLGRKLSLPDGSKRWSLGPKGR
jgi:hypothetical protein